MKKLTSLLLALVMMFMVACVVGCEWEEIFGTTTTTTTGMPDPSELIITHGDNFTDEDIDFLRYVHGLYLGSGYLPHRTFSIYVDLVNDNRESVYFIRVNKSEPIYLCGYYDLTNERAISSMASERVDIENFTWYKYTDKESVPEEIDNLALGWVLRLCDATVTKDIGKGIDCEHKMKIYDRHFGGFDKYDAIYEYTILFTANDLVNMQYLLEPDYSAPYYQSYFKGFISAAGESYFVLKYGKIRMEDGSISDCLDDNRNHIGDCYDVLSPYIERLAEMDYEFSTPSGEMRTFLVHGVPIDVLTELLFKKGVIDE